MSLLKNDRSQPRRESGSDETAAVTVAGIGRDGLGVLDLIMSRGMKGIKTIAADSDGARLDASPSHNKILLPTFGEEAEGDIAAAADAISGAMSSADLAFVISSDEDAGDIEAADFALRSARAGGATAVSVMLQKYPKEDDEEHQWRPEKTRMARHNSDMMIFIPNDIERKPLSSISKGITSLLGALLSPGQASLSMDDIRGAFIGARGSVLGVGEASGEGAAAEAAKIAIKSPILDRGITGAKRVMFVAVSGPDTTYSELNEAGAVIAEAADDDVNGILWGHTVDEAMGSSVRIVVIASEFDDMKGRREEMRRQVTGYLDREGYRYDDSVPDHIRLGFNLQCKLGDVQILMKFFNHGYRTRGCAPIKVIPENRDEVMRFMTMANCGMINGSFDLDLHDGEMSYRSFTSYEDMIVLSDAVIDRSFDVVCNMFEEYGNGLVDVMMGYTDAKAAIAAIEGTEDE